MRIDFQRATDVLCRHAVRHLWTTTQQKWTTGFVIGGMVLASVAMPPFGIAVFGTAFAGWWIAVLLVAVVSALVGNRIGIGREKAELLRRKDR